MRLIDADALIAKLEEEKKGFVNVGYVVGLDTAQECIKDAPTVEPKTGRWFGAKYDAGLGLFICDNCGKFSFVEYDYCPNCGADMRGEQDD